MRKVLSVFIGILVYSVSQGQYRKDLKVAVNQTVVLNYIEYTVYAQILTTDNKIKVHNNLFYYWMRSGDIKTTRGGYDGKLLHGTYTEFYPNKNLKEKGEFRYGLKNGEWKSWHTNGQFKEVCKWHRGKRHGHCRIYNEEGRLTGEERYKKGERHGKAISYKEDGTREVKKFKDGSERTSGKPLKNLFKKKKVQEEGSKEKDSLKEKENKKN